jgi:hypothetical protein
MKPKNPAAVTYEEETYTLTSEPRRGRIHHIRGMRDIDNTGKYHAEGLWKNNPDLPVFITWEAEPDGSLDINKLPVSVEMIGD